MHPLCTVCQPLYISRPSLLKPEHLCYNRPIAISAAIRPASYVHLPPSLGKINHYLVHKTPLLIKNRPRSKPSSLQLMAYSLWLMAYGLRLIANNSPRWLIPQFFFHSNHNTHRQHFYPQNLQNLPTKSLSLALH